MSKIAIFNDTHFGARNDSQIFNDYFYHFYDDIFFPYLIKNNIKTCIHLGDVLDKRKQVSYRIAKDFRERLLERFVEQDIKVHMIAGNHDCFMLNTNKINSLSELIGDKYPNIKVYSESEVVNIDGLDILLVAWINSENHDATMKLLQTAKADVCMGHLEINGFEMYSGEHIKSGYTKEMFKRFEKVLSGHFHKKSDDGHIYYLGCPYEITWHDYNCPKGFHIFDTETKALTQIQNPYKMFAKIFYKEGMDIDFSKYENKFIKVMVVERGEPLLFDAFMENLNKVNTHDIKVVENFDQINIDEAVLENSEDTIKLINQYVDEYEETLDKKKMKSLLKDLYEQAEELA